MVDYNFVVKAIKLHFLQSFLDKPNEALHGDIESAQYFFMEYNNFNGTYVLEGVDLVLADSILPKAVLAVREGKIAAIIPSKPCKSSEKFKLSSPSSGKTNFSTPSQIESAYKIDPARQIDPAFENAPVIEAEGAFVLPSLVEMHIHGCGSWGFEKVSRPEDLFYISDFLETKGVGCYVPTILWEEKVLSELTKAILASGISRSRLPGIYLEGPFVNHSKRGGIMPENILEPDPKLAEHIIDISKGLIKICAMAPELDGIDLIYPVFQNEAVLVSLGHSDAKLSSIHVPPHPFSITHLFNAMTGIDHREGGLANFAFSQSPDYIELNGDGIHVNESCLKLCSRLISENSLMLISDAVIGAGLPYGEYSYYGRRVISSERGVRYADSDVLMGSNMLGIDIVKNYCLEAEVPLWRAVRAMSLVPRKALGLDKEYGSIEVGKMADIFLWDNELKTAVRPKALLASENGFKQNDFLGNRFQVHRLQKKD